MELKKLIDAGGEVVGVTRHHGSGRASGAAVEAQVAYVFTVDGGTLVRLLNAKAHAREAVGRRG